MRSGGNAIEVKRRPNMRCAGLAVRFDLESFLPSGREPDGVEGWGAARSQVADRGGCCQTRARGAACPGSIDSMRAARSHRTSRGVRGRVH